jgi:hypothetical protein
MCGPVCEAAILRSAPGGQAKKEAAGFHLEVEDARLEGYRLKLEERRVPAERTLCNT